MNLIKQTELIEVIQVWYLEKLISLDGFENIHFFTELTF